MKFDSQTTGQGHVARVAGAPCLFMTSERLLNILEQKLRGIPKGYCYIGNLLWGTHPVSQDMLVLDTTECGYTHCLSWAGQSGFE